VPELPVAIILLQVFNKVAGRCFKVNAGGFNLPFWHLNLIL